MSQILVRNLSRGTVDELKQRARRNGRSLQAEARSILEAAVVTNPDLNAFREFARLMREANGPQTTDSADLIRQSRDELDAKFR